jgi:hypothetical protein
MGWMINLCTFDFSGDAPLPDTSGYRIGFYNLDAGRKLSYNERGYPCQSHGSDCAEEDFTWTTKPGWLADNTEHKAHHYHMIYGYDSVFTDCTENRTTKNVGGVWSKCGDDFTQWLDTTVPRPPTCDDPTITPTCSL